MRFYTPDECESWLTERNRLKPKAIDGSQRLRIDYPSEPYRMYYIAHWISTQLTYQQPALLWVTEWGVWGSSENWHMYYRLRQSYGDHRLLHEAPGHLFLDYETEDFTSFLELSMLNGWGGYVLSQANYANLFFSHDEFIDIFSDNKDLLDEVQKGLAAASRKPHQTDIV